MPSNKKPESILPTAGRISVTVVHDSTKSYGLRLSRQTKSDGGGDGGDDFVIDMIANTHSNGMLKGSPLHEGDILRTINNRRASEFLSCHGSSSHVKGGSFQDGQSVTFVAERPPPETETNGRGGSEDLEDVDEEPEGGSAIVRAFCRRSMNNNKNDGRAMKVGVEFRRVVVGAEEEEEEKDQEGNNKDGSNENDESDDASSTSSTVSSSFLQINRIDPNGLFAHSVLNQGDIVLAVNGYSICADENTTVEEANELMGIGIHTSSQQPALAPGVSVYETVDILALNPRKLVELRHASRESSKTPWRNPKQRQKWVKDKAKKAGVAMGGGAMIGVGIVVHPLGIPLICSGVSFLGTEFESPNKMVRNARDSLEKWAVVSDEQQMVEFSQDLQPREASAAAKGGPTEPSTLQGVSFGREDPFQRVSFNSFDSGDTTDPTLIPPSLSPLPPRPTMKNRMKGLGRRYVLPLMNRMAGDRQNTTSGIEGSSSFDINENHNTSTTADSAHPKQKRLQDQQEQQQRRHQLQGRDDDCGSGYGSSSSLKQKPPTSPVPQRVA